MKSVKKILMGIAIILFGIAINSGTANNLGTDPLFYVGWIVSLIGLFISFMGYCFTEDE